MEIEVDEECKTVDFWLTRHEGQSGHIIQSLTPLFGRLKEQGYLSVVFLSGKESLVELTSDLLRRNLISHTPEEEHSNDLSSVRHTRQHEEISLHPSPNRPQE